jgi:hypothetical protein
LVGGLALGLFVVGASFLYIVSRSSCFIIYSFSCDNWARLASLTTASWTDPVFRSSSD